MRPSKNFPIGLSNAVLEPKHYLAMRGDALWFYSYLLDRQGKHLDKNGLGKVAAGAPILDEDVAGTLGCCDKTVARWRGKLVLGGYITTRRTPYGYVYAITKPKKWKEKTPERSDSSVLSLPGEIGHICPPDRTHLSETKKRYSVVTVEAVEKTATTAVSQDQMESELLKVWGYYLEAFDKEETFSPSAKRTGAAILSRLHKLGQPEPVSQLTAAIYVAHHLVKTQPKKAFFANWFAIFGKWNTFASLREQWTEEM